MFISRFRTEKNTIPTKPKSSTRSESVLMLLEELKYENSEAKGVYQQSLESFSQEIQLLKLQLESKAKAYEEAKIELGKMKEEIIMKNCEKDNENHKDDLDSSPSSVSGMIRLIGNLRKQIQVLEEEKSFERRSKNALESRYKELTESYNSKNALTLKLQSKIIKLKTEYEELSKKSKNIKRMSLNDADQLDDDTRYMFEQITNLRNELKQASDENTQLNAKITKMENEKKMNEIKEKNYDLQIKNAQSLMETANGKMKFHQQEEEVAKEKVKELEKANMILLSQVQALKSKENSPPSSSIRSMLKNSVDLNPEGDISEQNIPLTKSKSSSLVEKRLAKSKTFKKGIANVAITSAYKLQNDNSTQNSP